MSVRINIDSRLLGDVEVTIHAPLNTRLGHGEEQERQEIASALDRAVANIQRAYGIEVF